MGKSTIYFLTRTGIEGKTSMGHLFYQQAFKREILQMFMRFQMTTCSVPMSRTKGKTPHGTEDSKLKK